jgi:hypothetical protein
LKWATIVEIFLILRAFVNDFSAARLRDFDQPPMHADCQIAAPIKKSPTYADRAFDYSLVIAYVA